MWLENYEHIHAAQGSALKRTPGVGQDDKPDGSDATQTVDVRSSMVPDDDGDALVDILCSAVEPSLTRSKCNSKVLKETNITCGTDVTILQNGNKDMAKEGPNLECSPAEESEFLPLDRNDIPEEEHGKLVRTLL